VGQGIAYNVEQRAFLDTISSKIATTFEATDATLLKLVRIQQQDTTAARLGMESALTAFLNNMYETTEYMTEAADSIRANIYEASALMGAAEATAFEYQVQK
jgi:Flp pilus assembly CpaE family ATPase